jgi:hypothetical protein
MSQPLQKRIVDGALVIISDESRWIRGRICDTDDVPEGTKFCARGAMLYYCTVELGLLDEEACDLVDRVSQDFEKKFGCVLTDVNDQKHNGHEAILATLKALYK